VSRPTPIGARRESAGRTGACERVPGGNPQVLEGGVSRPTPIGARRESAGRTGAVCGFPQGTRWYRRAA